MASIDKLMGNYAEYWMLYDWVMSHQRKLFVGMYEYDFDDWRIERKSVFPIANFTHKEDVTLLWRCPLPFVREYLAEQCGMSTRWYHKLFWQRSKL